LTDDTLREPILAAIWRSSNVRENNEDSYVCDPATNLWIVAEGMGGLGFGEVASAIATHTVTTHIQKGNGVNEAIELAHQRSRDYAETDPRKNAVTRALGVQELDTVRANSISDKWKPNQKILLCSNGLSDLVNLAEIDEVLVKKINNQEMVNELMVKALAAGGKDNITVVIISAPNQSNQVDQDTYVPDDITDNTKIRDDDETKSADN
jgi:serine/threonine protein phosphatase PrpC